MEQKGNQPRGFQPIPLLLIAIGLLLIAGVVIWQVAQSSNNQVSTPLPLVKITEDPNRPSPQIQRVALKDAKAAFDDQTAIFIDVRSKESYAEGHIPGAINIPLAELEARTGELNANDWIITYCT